MLSHQDRTSSATAQSDQLCFVNSLASHILLSADHHGQQISALIGIFPISTIKWEIMSTYALRQPLHSSWNLFTYSLWLTSGTLPILTSECNLLCNCLTNSSAGILMPDHQMLQMAGGKTSQISNSTLFWHNLFCGCDYEMKEWDKFSFIVACEGTSGDHSTAWQCSHHSVLLNLLQSHCSANISISDYISISDCTCNSIAPCLHQAYVILLIKDSADLTNKLLSVLSWHCIRLCLFVYHQQTY